MENKDWREEFDEQFRQGEQAWHPNFVLVVSFIESLLKSKQEEIEKVKFTIYDEDERVKKEVVELEDVIDILK